MILFQIRWATEELSSSVCFLLCWKRQLSQNLDRGVVHNILAFKHPKVQGENEKEQSSSVSLKCVSLFTPKLWMWMRGFDSPGCVVQVILDGHNCYVEIGVCMTHNASHNPNWGAFSRTLWPLSYLLTCYVSFQEHHHSSYLYLYLFPFWSWWGRKESRSSELVGASKKLPTIHDMCGSIWNHVGIVSITKSCALKESLTFVVYFGFFFLENPAHGVVCLWSKKCLWLGKKIWTCFLKQLQHQPNTSLKKKYLLLNESYSFEERPLLFSGIWCQQQENIGSYRKCSELSLINLSYSRFSDMNQ